MLKLLSHLAGLGFLAMILFGTWPIIFGKDPVQPIVQPSTVEEIKDEIADNIKDFELN